jgi:GLPGLI family protein
MATYLQKYQYDSTDPSGLRNSTMVLLLGPNVSLFVNRANYMLDTAMRRFTTKEQAINYISNPQVPKAAVLYRIYKNYPKGKITFTDHIPSDTYRFEEYLDIINWQIWNDTSTVCGYKSQKATCDFGGRSWVAWFAPELPYSDGPYKFNGLPGLIVKISDTRNHYDFELISVNKLDPGIMIDIEDKNYIVTTKQGFFKAYDSFINDFITRARQTNPGNDLQTVAKNMASQNNPIELLRK